MVFKDIQFCTGTDHVYFEDEQFISHSWTSPSAFFTDFWQKAITAQNPYQKVQGMVDRGEYCGRLEVAFSGFRQDVLSENTPFTARGKKRYSFSGSEVCGELSIAQITAPSKLYEQYYRMEPQQVLTYRFEDRRIKDAAEGITVTLHLPRSCEMISNGYVATTHFLPVLDPREGVLVARSDFHQENDSFATVLAIGVAPIGGNGRLRHNNESGGHHPGIRDKDPIMIGQETETQLRFCLEPDCSGLEVFAAVLADTNGKYLAQFGTNYVRKAAGLGFRQLLEQE